MRRRLQEPVWVDRLVVDAVHLDSIRAHGGLPGLRDENALESALARPRNRWVFGRTRDLATLAATYGIGLVRSHPYRDGNKRIGFLTLATFLGLNGYEIEAPEAEVVTVFVNLAAGRMSESALAKWIRADIVPLPDD